MLNLLLAQATNPPVILKTMEQELHRDWSLERTVAEAIYLLVIVATVWACAIVIKEQK